MDDSQFILDGSDHRPEKDRSCPRGNSKITNAVPASTRTIRDRDIPDNLRAKLEQEHEQFQQLLRDWNATRQQWLEAREKRLQETLAKLERMELRDSYKELKFALKIQRKRWHEVLRSLRSRRGDRCVAAQL